MIELASHLTALRISSLRSSHDSYPSDTLGSIMRSFDSIGPLLLRYCLVYLGGDTIIWLGYLREDRGILWLGWECHA